MYKIKNTLLKGLLVIACGFMAFGVGQMSGYSPLSSNQHTDQVQVVPVRGHGGGGGHWGGHGGHFGHGGWGGGGYSVYIGPGYGYGYGYPYGYGYDSYYYSPNYYYYPY
jgi:hypothetical protein